MIKLQQFVSKCTRDIVEAGDRNKERSNQTESHEEWKEKHQANIQIRKTNRIPTLESKLYGEKLCDIYRWYTKKASTYLNNKNEFEADKNHHEILWGRLQQIIKGREK